MKNNGSKVVSIDDVCFPFSLCRRRGGIPGFLNIKTICGMHIIIIIPKIGLTVQKHATTKKRAKSAIFFKMQVPYYRRYAFFVPILFGEWYLSQRHDIKCFFIFFINILKSEVLLTKLMPIHIVCEKDCFCSFPILPRLT